MQKTSFKDIDQYIATFPKDIQSRLQKIRETIHDTAPNATEAISYQMPTFKLGGKNLVHFAGFKNHIGIYPFPSTIEALTKELALYKTSKGTIQFQHSDSIPFDLLKKVVRARVAERTSA